MRQYKGEQLEVYRRALQHHIDQRDVHLRMEEAKREEIRAYNRIHHVSEAWEE
jgi:hypothetical protein